METRSPRLLVVSSAPPVKRLPALFLELLDSGADLVFSTPPDGLPESLRTRVATVDLPLRPPDESVAVLRAAADLARYLGPELADARWPRRRATRRLLKLVGHPDANRHRRAGGRLRAARRSAREARTRLPRPRAADPGRTRPSSRRSTGWRVDAVLIVSRCLLGGPEPDVIKAATMPRPSVDHAGLELGQPLEQGDPERASRPPARLERASRPAKLPSCTGSRPTG